MKPWRIFFVFAASLIYLSPGLPQQNSDAQILPDDFSAMAFSHIVYLAGLGHRHVGTENDQLAIQYIKNQFDRMGVEADIEPFEFGSFEYEKATLVIGKTSFHLSGLGFNPANIRKEYEGSPLLIDLSKREFPYTPQEAEGRTIITNDWNGHFRLLRYNPGLIIYLDPLEFEKIRLGPDLHYKLSLEGGWRTYRSANIVARVGQDTSCSKEIIVSAHFDTYRRNNPGASDNASGVGVLLELARYFKAKESELNCVVKFVAFGAEEIGLTGSRHYLHDNSSSLQNCELMFNIDNVGGNASVVLEIDGGVSGIPEIKGSSQIPDNLKTCSWEGIDSKWRLVMNGDLRKIMGVSNHPQWLVDVVTKTVEGLGYSFETAQNMGSDQLVFAQAGIVACGLSIGSQEGHTPYDVPEKINKTSLKAAGEIAAHIVLNTLNRFKSRYS